MDGAAPLPCHADGRCCCRPRHARFQRQPLRQRREEVPRERVARRRRVHRLNAENWLMNRFLRRAANRPGTPKRQHNAQRGVLRPQGGQYRVRRGFARHLMPFDLVDENPANLVVIQRTQRIVKRRWIQHDMQAAPRPCFHHLRQTGHLVLQHQIIAGGQTRQSSLPPAPS